MLRSVRLVHGANGTPARTPLSLMRMAVSVAIIATLALLATGKIAGAAVPNAPTIGTVTSTSANLVTVTWTDPVADGTAITGYSVVNAVGTVVATTTNQVATSLSFTPSAPLATTELAVVATSASGNSAPSSPDAISVPTAVSITSATVGNGTITFALADTAGTNLTDSSYTIYANGNVAGTCTSATACVLTDSTAGLVIGTAYSFIATATNADGTSLASTTTSATAGTSPSAITGATATVNYGASTPNVTIAWTAPSNTGGAALTYTISAGSHVLTSTATTSPLVESFTALGTAGVTLPYSGTFTISASNGIVSIPSTATTNAVYIGTTPSMPQSVVVSTTAVTWNAPSSPNSTYTYYVQYETCTTSNTLTCTASGTPVADSATTWTYALHGFTPPVGTYFDFAVYAVNNVGVSAVANGATSGGTAENISAATPGTPTGVVLSATNSSVTATWTPGSGASTQSVTLYKSVTAGTPVSVGASVATYTFTGLAPGTYEVQIQGSNASGNGTASSSTSPSIVVDSSPYGGSATTAPVLTPGASSWTVSWTAAVAAAATAAAPSTYSFASFEVYDATTNTVLGTVSGTTTTFTFAASAVHASDAVVIYSIGTYGVTSPPSSSVSIPAAYTSASGAPTIGLAYSSSTGIQLYFTTVGTSTSSYSIVGTGSDLSTVTLSVTAASLAGLIHPYVLLTYGTTYGSSTLKSTVSYTFKVAAVNPGGTSAYSGASAATVAATAPGAPTVSVTATSTTSTTIPVSITIPAAWGNSDDGTGDNATYSLTLTAPNGATTVVYPLSVTYTFTGLTPNTIYSVTANTIEPLIGSVASTAVSATTTGAPAAPTNVTAVAGTASGSVVVSWVAPTNLGGSSSSLSYVITSVDNGPAGSSAGPGSTPSFGSTTSTVSGFTAGDSYTISVLLHNSQGNGTPATVSIALPTVPGAPTGVAATPTANASNTTSAGSDTVTWIAPVSNGGLPITGYTVTPSTGTCVAVVGTATTDVCTGLTGGVTFTVKATNAWGNSSASTASASVTTVVLPTAPSLYQTGTATTGITVGVVDADPSVTSYTLQLLGGPTTLTATVTGTTYTFPASELSAAVTYTLVGVATNVAGNSATGSVTVASAPSAVTVFELIQDASTTLGTQGIVLYWAPAAGTDGYSVSYQVTGVQNGITTYSTTTTNTFVAIPYSSTAYTFTVYAVDAAGTSTGNTPSGSTYVKTDTTLPAAPGAGSPTVSLSGTTATLTWVAPSTPSTITPLTGYLVTLTPATGTALTQTIASGVTATFGSTTPLGVNTTYAYSIVATTALGNGPALTGTLTTAPAVPGAPTGVTAVASLSVTGTESVVVTWVAPTSTGGLPLTGYNVTVDGVGCPVVLTAASTTCTIVVPAGGPYQASVIAENAAGSSSADLSASIATLGPAAAPAAPTNLSVTTSAVGALTVNFTEAASTQLPLTGFALSTVDMTTGVTTTAAAVAGPTATSISLSGLSPTDSYRFVLVAVNNLGGVATPSANAYYTGWTGWKVPEAAPAISSATNSALGTIAVAWTAPVAITAGDAGSVVTGYTVTATNTSTNAVTTQSVSSSALSTTFTGLANGVTYTIGLVATNSIGSGPATTATVKTGAASTAPAPTLGAVTATSTSLTFSWTAPTVPTGTTITGYVASVATGNTTVTCGTLGATATSCTVPGLTPSTTYTISVSALTAGGTSPAATKTAATTAGVVTGPVPSPFQVLFAGNSTALSAAAKKALVAYALKLSSGADVTLTGYAKGNAFLAKSRATTVALFLEAAVSNMRFQLHEITTSSANSVFVVTVTV